MKQRKYNEYGKIKKKLFIIYLLMQRLKRGNSNVQRKKTMSYMYFILNILKQIRACN